MVLQPGSNGFAAWIKWFCNMDRMVLSNKNTKLKVQSFDVSGSADCVKRAGDSNHREEVNIELNTSGCSHYRPPRMSYCVVMWPHP